MTAADKSWPYLSQYAEETLPRYTSYPPANRFSPSIVWDQVAERLSALPERAKLSLYIHVPYCRRLCWYCGCHTSVPTKADPVEPYVQALLSEIEIIGAAVRPDIRIGHLHFGGGSPDCLEPSQISAIMERLHSTFSFAEDAEVAAELDPRGASKEVLAAFRSGGLNRVSFGLQDINPKVQSRINRVQDNDDVIRAVDRVRQHGISSINLDVMYGLPEQNLDDVVRTAEFAASLSPSRVAAFGYAHVPWFKKHQKAIDISSLAQREERFRQAEVAFQTFKRLGFVPIGFDHFAAPDDTLAKALCDGTLKRNFQGYTCDPSDGLIGLGVSSISSLPGLYWQSTTDTQTYKDTIADSRIPVARGAVVTGADKSIARLIETVLCFGRVKLPDVLPAETAERLSALREAGIIEVSGRHLQITQDGHPYARNVAASFDPEFVGKLASSSGQKRHSLAI